MWRGSFGQHVPHVLPHSPSLHTRGWILSASDGIWNILFSTYSHTSALGKIQWLSHVVLDLFSHISTGKIQWLFVSYRGSGFCDLFQLFTSFAQLSVVAVSEEAASEILLGAQPRVRCWSRARSSSSELVHACSFHGSSRRLAPVTGRVRLTLRENANSCSCSSSTCAIFAAVRMVQQASVGGPKKAESAHVFASHAFVTVTLGANMRGGMWTQIVYEGKDRPSAPSWTTLSAPARVPTLRLI